MTAPDPARIAARIALVGCGIWGRNIARNLAALGSLAGVDDLDLEAAAACSVEFDAPLMPFDRAIADNQIDGIAIAAPAPSHTALGVAALNAGKAVYIEKPLALNVDDAEKIAAAAAIHDRPVMVGHLIRHHAAFQVLLGEVQGGAIGTLKHISTSRLAPGRIRTTESVLFDLCPHDLALIAALTDQDIPRHITCHGFSHITPGVEDGLAAQFTFASGVTASIQASWLNPVKIHSLTVLGDEGALVFDDAKDWPEKLTRFAFKVGLEGIARDDGIAIALEPAEPLKAEMMNFIAAATGKAKPLTDLNEALYVQRIMARMQSDLMNNVT
jgi:UDP-2-acetamido-3-amino-2,3-dideoxy-glucuronate N-acetyltransferase